jgi:subtilase family serine protease
MLKYFLLFCLLFSSVVYAEPELLSDKERIKFSRTRVETLADGSVLAIYQAGIEGKERLLIKIKDLAALDNLPYSVEESDPSKAPITVKITFKNGLLLDKALKSLPERLP